MVRILWTSAPVTSDRWNRGTFVFFIGKRAADPAPITVVGNIEGADRFHLYDLLCRAEESSRGHGGIVYSVLKVLKSARIELSEELLARMMEIVLGYGPSLSRVELNNLSQTARSGRLGPLVTEAGDRRWFADLERRTTYFVRAYVDELCPPMNRGEVCSLPPDQICALYRAAIRNPWYFCFRTKHNLDLINDQSPELCGMVAKIVPPSDAADRWSEPMKFYRNVVWNARTGGNSFILPDCQAMTGVGFFLERGLLTRVREPLGGDDVAGDGEWEDHIYQTDDLEDENFFVHLIENMVCGPASAVPKEEGKCWPFSDSTGAAVSDEQRRVIRNSRKQRIMVVDGKPGTGKTTVIVRGIASQFARGDVVVATLTGIAAERAREVVGPVYTFHRLINTARREKNGGFNSAMSDRRALVIDECSNVTLSLLCCLLRELPRLERLYAVGDVNQMPPPGAGVHVMHALCTRYRGEPNFSSLDESFRVACRDSPILRNLDRILSGDGCLEYSNDPQSDEPFVLVERRRNVAEDVRTLREIFGHLPDHKTDMQIMVQTNSVRREMMREWYLTGPFSGRPYAENGFYVGETVMFLENSYGGRTEGCSVRSDSVMNGTIARIAGCFDVTVDGRTVGLENTFCPPTERYCNRFVRTNIADLTVCLDTYGAKNICRAQPSTISKVQGQEMDTAVVYIHRGVSRTFGSRQLYTACSRGKRRCIVVTDFTGDSRNPSADLTAIIKNRQEPVRSRLPNRLPSYGRIKSLEERT